MDNKEYPEQENPEFHPEAQPIPSREPTEDMPVIEELSFAPESSTGADQAPVSEEPAEAPALPTEEPSDAAEEILPMEESAAAEEAALPVEESATAEEAVLPVEETATEEAALPVEETAMEIPLEEAQPNLISLDSVSELTPDTRAMEFHGMLDHGEEEPPFDLSVLEDPELAIPEPQPVEEIQDQEYRDDSKEFDVMFHAPAPEKKEPEPPRQAPKGRPKRRKGEGLLGIPNILVTIVWLALIVAIGVTAGRMLWVCAADVLAFGREDKAVTVTIYESDTMEDIINKLRENGLIRYKSLFKFYADISDAEEDIKPGIYDLNTRYDYHALVNFMSPRSSREVITLTIPEGYTCAQIFRLLEEHRICTAKDIAAYAANGELDPYWFLEGLQRGSENCLEGYLFPDTYEFYKNSTPREALQRMLNNFDYRFDADMRAQIDTLNNTLTKDYTIREIAIVASLIEKESAAPAESPKIAGVIYNRLFHWGNNPPYLNIDASIVYAQGGDTERIDTKLDSPYNTYLYTGLTPGPIANPGLASLKAALNPESHNYYYYVLNPATGMHQFSTTYEEHTGYVRSFAEG